MGAYAQAAGVPPAKDEEEEDVPDFGGLAESLNRWKILAGINKDGK